MDRRFHTHTHTASPFLATHTVALSQGRRMGTVCQISVNLLLSSSQYIYLFCTVFTLYDTTIAHWMIQLHTQALPSLGRRMRAVVQICVPRSSPYPNICQNWRLIGLAEITTEMHRWHRCRSLVSLYFRQIRFHLMISNKAVPISTDPCSRRSYIE